MKQIHQSLAFLKKNRIIIYTLLGIALMMQICSRGALPPIHSETPISENIETIDITKPLSGDTTQDEEPRTDFTTLLIMTIAALGFFVAKRYGWLNKLYPQVVVFRVQHFKQKSTGNLILKIVLINHTKRDISFLTPTIVFFKGKKNRAFNIKNIGGQNYFPLTLMPGTGQKFTIDAQKFYAQVEGLNQYKTICMKISSITGKTYQSTKWPVALTFRKL